MADDGRPAGFHTLTPYFRVTNAGRLIEFLKAAFGAEETFRMERDDGTIEHASLRIGESMLMMTDVTDDLSVSCTYVYVPDVDETYRAALDAGAESLAEPADQYWGDRFASVKDQFGNTWLIATSKSK
jgi:PhnB protein